ncbi:MULTISPECIES: ribosome hibernation-promoting factor, HPF/YfiA family [Actinomadura]|uniref:Ribosome hibernation promoting factor n=1 Tax=Actinomadura citrea TaxID=46158 RepID=A0A7Y9GIB5_9ACTN|nr:ribosome-associated translation inhibitor RaiA [Actinomadura citrea]NYE17014.1 ribosomal subunit interface protein [Actinomadura citrea]GGT59594.1 ribosomal subunit interface protein [Actinomadura citrea]
MNITVRGRHTDVNDRFRRHVDNKLAKIERLDQKVIRVDVEVSEERNPRLADQRERVELTIRSRGPVIRAEAAADDRYGALDLALDKLESQLRRDAERRKGHGAKHHGGKGRAKLATMETLPETLPAVGPEPVEPAAQPVEAEAETEVVPQEENLVPIPMDGDGPLVVREKFHQAEPMGIEQALFEMELVGHDFFLYRDKSTGHPSVVYRRRGWDYGVIRLVEE